jgi:rhodanese-related sulfurtransferase
VTRETGTGPSGEGAAPAVPEVPPVHAHRLVVAAEAVLVDVRDEEEWEAGHAPGAYHLPLHRLSADRLSADRLPVGTVLITVCRSGARSTHAAAHLAAAGREVRNVPGGMRAWLEARLPVVRDDGSTGTVI